MSKLETTLDRRCSKLKLRNWYLLKVFNNCLEEFKDEITAKEPEIQTLKDASTDMMMLEIDDEKISLKYEIKDQILDLKTHLYAKFGYAINLENDE